jgi:tetratricopeptide (TPR) repeat protein
VARSLCNLAAIYMSQGRAIEAERLSQRALAIREKAFGMRHPTVASSLNNLAAVYHSQERDARAESRAERALRILEEVLGSEDWRVAAMQKNLAKLRGAGGTRREPKVIEEHAASVSSAHL